jgi:flagellar hook-associated protein FlgK
MFADQPVLRKAGRQSLQGSGLAARTRERQMNVGGVGGNSTLSTAVEGLKKASNTLQNAAQNIAGGSQDPEDIVSLSQASTGFKANAAVIKAEDQMTKSLLDIKA